ncbi:hypothetical protein JCM37173_07470 [Allocoprococcus similis]
MRRDEESVVLLETFDYRAFIEKHVLFSLNMLNYQTSTGRVILLLSNTNC